MLAIKILFLIIALWTKTRKSLLFACSKSVVPLTYDVTRTYQRRYYNKYKQSRLGERHFRSKRLVRYKQTVTAADFHIEKYTGITPALFLKVVLPYKHFMALMVVYKLGNMMLEIEHPDGLRA